MLEVFVKRRQPLITLQQSDLGFIRLRAGVHDQLVHAFYIVSFVLSEQCVVLNSEVVAMIFTIGLDCAEAQTGEPITLESLVKIMLSAGTPYGADAADERMSLKGMQP